MIALSEKPLAHGASTKLRRPAPAARAAKIRRPNFFVSWSFYLFAFSMPLENVDPFGIAHVFSITRMAGLLFAFCCLFQPRLCFARPPRAFWFFVAYALIFVLLGLIFSVGYEEAMMSRLQTLGQNLVMFWLCCNLMRHDEFATRGLLSFGAGCIVLSLLLLAGIGMTVTETRIGARVSAFEENANVFAFYMSLGLLMLVGLLIGRTKVKTRRALFLSPLFLIMLYHIIQSGSRGAMLCFGAGLLVILYRPGSLRYRLQVLAVVALLLIVGMSEIQRSEGTARRWRQTIETGSASGRREIMGKAAVMVGEKPLVGWGPVRNLVVLARRCGHLSGMVVDTHNDLLWVLTATGLAGGIPFVAAVVLCVRGAWRARKRVQGVLPLALIGAVLVMSLSGTIANRKATWMVLAYAVAGATCVAAAPAKRLTRLRAPRLRAAAP